MTPKTRGTLLFFPSFVPYTCRRHQQSREVWANGQRGKCSKWICDVRKGSLKNAAPCPLQHLIPRQMLVVFFSRPTYLRLTDNEKYRYHSTWAVREKLRIETSAKIYLMKTYPNCTFTRVKILTPFPVPLSVEHTFRQTRKQRTLREILRIKVL